MKIVDANSGLPVAPFRVRINRTGRRTYSREYKLEIVHECSGRDVSVARVALAHGIKPGAPMDRAASQRAVFAAAGDAPGDVVGAGCVAITD